MDCRSLARAVPKWYSSLDKKRMRVGIQIVGDEDPEEALEGLSKEAQGLLDDDYCVTFPMKFKVCSTCRGTGSHVDPSIDSHGITGDEWDRDWSYEDRENYMSGFYNVACYECGGERVVPEIDETFLTDPQKELLSHINERREAAISYAIERQREIEMGY